VKHLVYPVFLALVGAVILFNYLANRRGIRVGVIRLVNVSWCLAACVFMVVTSEPHDWFHDFRAGYWHAGRLVLARPADMYGLDELTFVNIPVTGLLFVPFAGLGEYQAGMVFSIIALAAMAATWLLLVRQARLTVQGRWLLAALFVTSGPLFYSLRHGNSTTFVLPLLAFALICLESGRSFCSGALLGVAGLIKPPLLLLPAYYTLRRRWRVVAGAATVGVVAGASSLALFGWDVHVIWYERCIRPFAGKPLAAYNAQSIGSALARFVAPGDFGELWVPIAVTASWARWTKVVECAVIAVTLLVCLRPIRKERCTAHRLDFCLMLCLALVISPVTWTHYFLLLLLPAALYLGNQLGQPRTRATDSVMAVAFLAMSPPVRGWALRHWYTSLLVSHSLAGALLVMAVLAVARWRLSSPSLAAPQFCERLRKEPLAKAAKDLYVSAA
jgi:hypothetical protein